MKQNFANAAYLTDSDYKSTWLFYIANKINF